MKKLLICGFEPFDGEATNPSWDAVLQLGDVIGDYRLEKLLVPVVFGRGAACVVEVAEELHPDVILCIGQAGGRAAVTPELVGINLRYGRIADNDGNRPEDVPIAQGGACAYFSPLPVRRMAEAIRREGIPSEVSYSAGAYVCNDLLYTLLSHYEGGVTRVGFIHVPYSTEQNKQPAMELVTIIRALEIAIMHLDA